MPTTARQEKAAAVANGAVPKPRGKAPKAYPLWDVQQGVWMNEAGDMQPSKKRAVEPMHDKAPAAAALARSTTAPLDHEAAASAAACSTTALPDSRMRLWPNRTWIDVLPPLLLDRPPQTVHNWGDRLQQMGFDAGHFAITYAEAELIRNQKCMARRHSV